MTPRLLTPEERQEIEERYTGRESTQWSARIRKDMADLLAAEAYRRERAERLAGAYCQFLDRVRRLAFEMPPPNIYTPCFVQMCLEATAALAEEPKP